MDEPRGGWGGRDHRSGLDAAATTTGPRPGLLAVYLSALADPAATGCGFLQFIGAVLPGLAKNKCRNPVWINLKDRVSSFSSGE